jgi:tetratricopeptide (TPR) repeat protein
MFTGTPEAEKKYRAAALTQIGIDLYDAGRFEPGLAAFRRALTLEPNRVRALRGMALCLSQLGRAAEGLGYAEKAVELARDPGLAYATLGLVLHRLGRDEEAEKAFDLGVKNTPDDYRVYYNFACYWAERGNETACRNYLELALELAPSAFASQPAKDPDLGRYSRQEWFVDLIAALKKRPGAWAPEDKKE